MTVAKVFDDALKLADRIDINEDCVANTVMQIKEGKLEEEELCSVLRKYSIIYDDYQRLLLMFNYVRVSANDGSGDSPDTLETRKRLVERSKSKIKAYLERQKGVIRKMDKIVLSLSAVDDLQQKVEPLTHTYGPIVFLSGSSCASEKCVKKFRKKKNLEDGTYLLTVRNATDVDVAVTVVLRPDGSEECMRTEVSVPEGKGWRKVIGVLRTAQLGIEAETKGETLANFDVFLQAWKPKQGRDAACEGVKDGPTSSEATKPPHTSP